MTRKITVGGVEIGGGAPVTVQSMTNTRTDDVEATVSQIISLKTAGCDIVRVAVPDMAAARAISDIKERVDIPIVADIHFDYRLALEAAARGVDKIRINPGNIGSDDRVRAVADECGKRGIPIRIGVNGGSIEKHILAKYGAATPEAMCESALYHARLLERYGFEDIAVSMKAADVPTTVAAYRMAREMFDYPLHLGITHTGTAYGGLIKSAMGIGALLLDGIGDTLRVSLTAPPEEEVRAGIEILRAAGLRTGGVRIISCPTCGRCEIDLFSLADEAEKRLKGLNRDLTVAIMGCVVNGPGEAKEADYGIAGGRGVGILFKKGKIVKKVGEDAVLDELMAMIRADLDT